jgi:hypothetical protein
MPTRIALRIQRNPSPTIRLPRPESTLTSGGRSEVPANRIRKLERDRIESQKPAAAANGKAEPLVRTRDHPAGPTGDRTYPKANIERTANTSRWNPSSEIFQILREGDAMRVGTGPEAEANPLEIALASMSTQGDVQLHLDPGIALVKPIREAEERLTGRMKLSLSLLAPTPPFLIYIPHNLQCPSDSGRP